jgi:hypothetical protein
VRFKRSKLGARRMNSSRLGWPRSRWYSSTETTTTAGLPCLVAVEVGEEDETVCDGWPIVCAAWACEPVLNEDSYRTVRGVHKGVADQTGSSQWVISAG